MALTVVETYADTMQAHIAKGLLESHGIEATIFHEGFHNTYGAAVGEVPLMVDEENLIRAKEILGSELDNDSMETFSA
ncbi:putative signal transducing protein [Kangiella sediminilitoris]|uniref:DUF2007 domain-containing protein n=1 Tax=Kangiella sediminilitoris TaxID=1144748 RepID=A0A1B3B7P6_9GAMM|nr:DUF2007 domain-containing protein [Kangiella sediminilitoris]AOE48814.1 hypothetical protein KS2013_82 [Kangiella sediminilitoris]